MNYSIQLKENTINEAAIKMDEGMKALSGQTFILQTYCTAIISQPFVDFGSFKRLQEIQKKINDGLEKAKDYANNRIGTIQTEIITTISNISNYYNLFSSVPVIIPPDASKDQWINTLRTLEKQSKEYSVLASDTAKKIGTLQKDLDEDSSIFQANVSKLNALLGGNAGQLKDLEKQIIDIDGKIRGTIIGIVGSGLAIVGAIFLIGVGTLAIFATSMPTVLIVIGSGLFVGDVAGALGFDITLCNLLVAKSSILVKKAQLAEGEKAIDERVKTIAGISSSYNLLFEQVKQTHAAAQQMKKAWDFLGNNLGTLANKLNEGTLSTKEVRKLWLSAADNAVHTGKEDINIIKAQMTTGMIKASAPNDEHVGEFIKKKAEGNDLFESPANYEFWRYNQQPPFKRVV